MAEGRFKAFRVHGFAFTASGSALCLLLEASGLGLALGDITRGVDANWNQPVPTRDLAGRK